MATTIKVDSHTDKNALLSEANMQSKMIANLNLWLKVLLGLSGVGVILVWWGLDRESASIPIVVAGGAIAILCVIGVALVQRGIINGKKNVDRMMRLADGIKK